MCTQEIKVHPLTNDPCEVWMEIFESQTFINVEFEIPEECDRGKVRIVCMSDTHSKTSKFHFNEIPDGDIFIHAGDFTYYGSVDEVIQFNEWLGEILIKIHNSLVIISSRQPEYSQLAFNLARGEACLSKWRLIPADTDILVTHTPPLGRGDRCRSGVRAGCCELLNTVQQRVRPRYHVFGHIHEGYGVTSDGHTIYVNASTCNVKYAAVNPPIVFDVPLPPGFTKDGSVL
ncbi:UPF0046 protein C25E10.12 [Nilaparvata lugens]|uniref:UPF0046 protein C25E10.12 n=1 Tax=Nilaparvata lugens TaxID=108931 RepID=UPI00193D155C|nr:UPF0046 protein C25E10.12 [Nilaparvata lugens]